GLVRNCWFTTWTIDIALPDRSVISGPIWTEYVPSVLWVGIETWKVSCCGSRGVMTALDRSIGPFGPTIETWEGVKLATAMGWANLTVRVETCWATRLGGWKLTT